MKDNQNDLTLRREEKVMTMQSAKNKSTDFSNTRSYTSCENTAGRKSNISRNNWKSNKFSKKIQPMTNSNRTSGRFRRDAPVYGTNRTSGRGQTHSMYCMSNISNYVLLSAHDRNPNNSNEILQQRLKAEQNIKNSPHDTRKRQSVKEDINLKLAYQHWNKSKCHFFNCILPLVQKQ